MPSISPRGASLPASPIRKLAGAADRARAAGRTVFQLNIGQPDVASPQEFWDAVRGYKGDHLAYAHSAGLMELREKAAEVYQRRGIDVGPEHIQVTTSGSEALQMIMVGAMNPGDEIIVPEPMYANYIGFSAITDVNVVPLTTRIEDNFRLPSSEAFAERIGPRTKAILICNPGNPTGTIFDDQQLGELRALALKHDLYLIGDEVYRDFNYTDKPVKSVLQLEGMEQHAVMVDSASKRYSLCGARVGFLVTKNEALLDAALRYAQARLSSPTLEQIGLIGALGAPDSYTEATREEYRLRRDTLVRRLRAMPGVLCPDIEGAFYATVRLPVEDADAFCLWILEEFSHNNATVQMAPASGFYRTPGLGRDEVRIAYVLNNNDLNQAMDCLEAALAAYPGRKG